MRTFFRSVFSMVSMLALSTSMAAAMQTNPFPDTSRLVSVGGALTEIIYALGQQDLLVARDSTAVYPPQATSLPDVGYMRALAPEGVLSVNPSALLVIEGSGPPEVLEVLKQSGVPYQTIPDVPTQQGILDKINAVGVALNVQEKAAELARRADAELSRARALTANIDDRKRVLFVLSNRGGKLMVSGSNTAADAIISMAGGINAVGEFQGYKTLAHEAVLAARPDTILMMNRRGNHAATDEALLSDPAITLTPAGRDKSIIRMDGAYLLGFGPRTADAIIDLAKALYGVEIEP